MGSEAALCDTVKYKKKVSERPVSTKSAFPIHSSWEAFL